MNLMRALLVVVPAGIVIAAAGGDASRHVAQCRSHVTAVGAVGHGAEAASDHAAVGDSRRSADADAGAGISGEEDAASKQ